MKRLYVAGASVLYDLDLKPHRRRKLELSASQPDEEEEGAARDPVRRRFRQRRTGRPDSTRKGAPPNAARMPDRSGSGRAWPRRGQPPHAGMDWVKDAAVRFAQAAPMPMGAGKAAPMRDLKGWLARLLAEDVLERWVEAAAQLCQFAGDERKQRAELFTRTVLRTVSERDRTRSQSVDTTLRRHCCTALDKGLTFMKLLQVVFAAYDFARATSRCEAPGALCLSAPVAEKWAFRFDGLIQSFRAVRLCVKNDDASKELVASITSPTWASTLARLLLAEVHSECGVAPAAHFSRACEYVAAGGQEQVREDARDLARAIAESVISAAPNSIMRERVTRNHLSHTLQNDPICCAAMLMPHSPEFALALTDQVVGLTPDTGKSPIPIEVHREIRLFSHIRRLTPSRALQRALMVAFAPVFKCNKLPLEWKPLDCERNILTYLAGTDHWIAITVVALLHEDEGIRNKCARRNVDALNSYIFSGEKGDVFAATHAAQMLIKKRVGVRRNPVKAQQYLSYAAEYKIRVAVSHLADLLNGKGEPEVPRNEEEAARLYQVASDMGCYRATTGLAGMHKRGAGGFPKDEEMFEELVQKAGRQREDKQRLRCRWPAVGAIGSGVLSPSSTEEDIPSLAALLPPSVAPATIPSTPVTAEPGTVVADADAEAYPLDLTAADAYPLELTTLPDACVFAREACMRAGRVRLVADCEPQEYGGALKRRRHLHPAESVVDS